MKKILAARLKLFRSEEHCEFLISFRDLLLTFPVVQQVVMIFYDAFANLLLKEEQLINAMRKSDLTGPIAEEDRRIDRAITGMRQIIAAALHHFTPAVVKAAQSLSNRFEAFGDITRKAYEEEIIDINLLIADLYSAEYSTKATLVGLDDWITELSDAAKEFDHLLKLRYTESAQKPQGRIKDVRHEIDTLYHSMIERINAAAIMDATGAFEAYVAELNVRITYFNNHAHQRVRRDISVGDDCVIESIADQTYTGAAVTPLPRAYYREEGKPTVELVFARDFSVTYKNNVEIGMADVILHGKDAYRGQKRTTFNISRVK
jgi:hypothetical protein